MEAVWASLPPLESVPVPKPQDPNLLSIIWDKNSRLYCKPQPVFNRYAHVSHSAGTTLDMCLFINGVQIAYTTLVRQPGGKFMGNFQIRAMPGFCHDLVLEGWLKRNTQRMRRICIVTARSMLTPDLFTRIDTPCDGKYPCTHTVDSGQEIRGDRIYQYCLLHNLPISGHFARYANYCDA